MEFSVHTAKTAKSYLLLDFYSGATGQSGRFSEGFLLRRLHQGMPEKF